MSKKNKNDKHILEPIKISYLSKTFKNNSIIESKRPKNIIKINQVSKKVLEKNNISYTNDENDLIERLFIYKSKRKLDKKNK
jgi:hypothetical protein